MDTLYSTLTSSSLSTGLFSAVGLPRLAMYWPRVLVAVALFEAVYRLFAVVSPVLFPASWARMNKVERYKWCVRKASTVHAAYMVTRSLVTIADMELRGNPLHGTDPDAESAYAVAVGYFLWDMINTYTNLDMNGWGFMSHAVMSFSVYLLSFAPLLQYYGACFMMFEVSTIFLNVHLTLEDLGLKDYIIYYINGMALVSSFFFARIVYGTLLSINVWKELAASAVPINPVAAAIVRLSNIGLMGLSYYWFGAIIMTAKRSALDADLIRALEEMDQREAEAAQAKAAQAKLKAS
ncbi:hypothetical protein H4R18_002598 [Coemansia javaensis]|uniref:TLC domain-containing protein n=1 Tax=Coemansia javaensis TaxID=2761396 RepID=A0A9W8HG81_9FUNG|nr:hypothetical protein H4R18_002598 [Coemansia javaensis]